MQQVEKSSSNPVICTHEMLRASNANSSASYAVLRETSRKSRDSPIGNEVVCITTNRVVEVTTWVIKLPLFSSRSIALLVFGSGVTQVASTQLIFIRNSVVLAIMTASAKLWRI